MLDPPRNLSSEWGRLLIEGLASAGVRDVVVAPGSRSTPFVLAAIADGRLCCVELADERSAAFFALGQGRASGRPSLFVCTSGTAGAHAFPAVVEASAARVPLLVLTADRPFERRDCGAPQTIDQTHLFGHHVRWFVELGLPDADERALRSLQRRALQAVARARGPVAGPVHFNAPVRKPLEPVAPGEDSARLSAEQAAGCAELERRVSRIVARPPRFDAAASPPPGEGVVDRLAEALAAARRPLVVAGPAPLARWCERGAIGAALAELELPLYAEAPSQLALPEAELALPEVATSAAGLHRLAGFAGVLGTAACRSRLAPDLVLQLGAAPTAGGWEPAVERWCAQGDAAHVVIADGGWPDPVSTASWTIEGAVGDVLAAVGERSRTRGVPLAREEGWIEHLERLASEGQRVALELTSLDAPEAAPLSEPAAVRLVLEELPRGALLALGNSLPIRSVDLYAAGAGLPGPVWSQRGANGIDGLVSGAAGALAVWWRERATRTAASSPLGVLLLGDVSLRHDLGGLVTLRHLRAQGASHPQGHQGPSPEGEAGARLVIAVLDNGGGRIFDQLPAHALDLGDRWRFWSTPDSVDWASIAVAFELEYREAASISSARQALRELFAQPERSALVRLRVDPDSARVAGEVLRQKLATAAGADGGGTPDGG
jgi:2-succinyl-5-enolpyruvyl-6-hydroxy-3-cyclohexene-1-carboxylate synthase